MSAITSGRVISDEELLSSQKAVLYEIIHRRDLEKYLKRFG